MYLDYRLVVLAHVTASRFLRTLWPQFDQFVEAALGAKVRMDSEIRDLDIDEWPCRPTAIITSTVTT
jgi:hypothetical protein